MIVGIDGNGKSFVGFDVSNIVIKKKVPVFGTTIEVPLEQAIFNISTRWKSECWKSYDRYQQAS